MSSHPGRRIRRQKKAKCAASIGGEGMGCSPWLIEALGTCLPPSVIQQDEDKKKNRVIE